MITTYRIKINVSSILQASCHPSGWWSEELRSGRCCGLGGGWVGEGRGGGGGAGGGGGGGGGMRR